MLTAADVLATITCVAQFLAAAGVTHLYYKARSRGWLMLGISFWTLFVARVVFFTDYGTDFAWWTLVYPTIASTFGLGGVYFLFQEHQKSLGDLEALAFSQAKPTVVCSGNGALMYSNNAAASSFGPRWSWINLVHPEDLERVGKIKEGGLATSNFEAEVRLREVDGEYRWYYLNAFFIRCRQGSYRWFVRFNNIETYRLSRKIFSDGQA